MARPTPYQVKALYEYASPHDDDLSFPNGQILTVTEEEDADWYYGEYLDHTGAKQEGLFPRNFVKIHEPETPPRPSRSSRHKRELEPASTTPKEEIQEPQAPQAEDTVNAPDSKATTAVQSVDKSLPPNPNEAIAEKPSEVLPSTKTKSAVAPSSVASSGLKKDVENPVSGSFRDRINAFNKPAAPPVAPKPGSGSSGGSGFVKKPFVAPPPSKNAYIPPPRDVPVQKTYRREEDPELIQQINNAEKTERGPPPELEPGPENEDLPKPTSLKDRIALLQKQQMEQAARQADVAQKKEKPKRPAKKRTESQERPTQDDRGQIFEQVHGIEGIGPEDSEVPPDYNQPEPPVDIRQQRLREPDLAGSPSMSSRGFQSDANDADQSGAGDTEDGEDLSTSRDDSDEKSHMTAALGLGRAAQAPSQEPDVGDEEDEAEEDRQDEQDVDPEVKRRMEIRERMAKMSGGMGMAGMFGPPGGMPGMAQRKQSSFSSERKTAAPAPEAAQASIAPPVPIMPMPGLQKVLSPEQNTSPIEVKKEETEGPHSVVQGLESNDIPDVEDMEEEPQVPQRRSTERAAPSRISQDPSMVPSAAEARGVPPPLPTERPVPPVPVDSRPIPSLPADRPMSPSTGSESDDEMPAIDRHISSTSSTGRVAQSKTGGDLAAIPDGPTSSLPSRTRDIQPIPVADATQKSAMGLTEASPTSPKTPTTFSQRTSRVPPIPGSGPTIPPPVPQNRAPPPPPPTTAPSRTSTGGMPAAPQVRKAEDSDDEITEYEGDYDTDMAADATHKDALKAYAKASSVEDDSATDEATLHHSGLPSLGPAPRAVPPPPPNQPPKLQRQSSDMPRAPPPPPPPKEQVIKDEEDEYDPYNYTASKYQAKKPTEPIQTPPPQDTEDPDGLYSASPPRRSRLPPSSQSTQQYGPPSSQPPQQPPSRGPRQSLDVQRASTNARRSTDIQRPSGEHAFIASDVDLSQSSQWWRQPNAPPPALQNRRDIIYEVEDTSTTRRGGRQAVTRVVYVLYMDYSQTTITARFESRDPGEVALEQHHEPPPPRMRQDQLEDANARYGARIAEEASSKKDTTVRDGTSQSLILDLLTSHPDALLPVGTRAYGALVYTNLANASVQQFDEIRPGDIVSFRNARFQGHRGAMHAKYSVEVGKPDHVGVVVDWDGTKKKVRAWEQGRDSKKVKMESFKLGDMRSGEAKVWRVMSREWVRWQGQN